MATTKVRSTDAPPTRVRVTLWVLRVAALATGATVPLLADRLDQISDGASLLATIVLWSTWGLVLLGVAVPSSVSLTVVRVVAPIHLVVTSILVVGEIRTDGPDSRALLALVPIVVTAVAAATAEIGTAFVQASAYGDETRVLLLPPPSFAAVLVTSWTIWIASSIVGALALLREAWVAGGILVAVGAVATVLLPRRFHRFSRRWLVFVPAGLVVHDHVVLAETAMFPRSSIRSLTVGRRDDEAADLSGARQGSGRRAGRGAGLAVETTDFETVVLAPTPSRPGGSALHVKTWWIRPSRPGRAISAWARPSRRVHSS